MSIQVTRTPARAVEQLDLVVGPVKIGLSEGGTDTDPLRLSLSKADFYKFAEDIPIADLKQVGQEIVDYCARIEANRKL